MLSTGRCRNVILRNGYRLGKPYDDDKMILKHHSIMNYKNDRSSVKPQRSFVLKKKSALPSFKELTSVFHTTHKCNIQQMHVHRCAHIQMLWQRFTSLHSATMPRWMSKKCQKQEIYLIERLAGLDDVNLWAIIKYMLMYEVSRKLSLYNAIMTENQFTHSDTHV